MNFTLPKGSIPEGLEKRVSHLYGITGVIIQPFSIGEGMVAFAGYFRHDLKTGRVCDGQLIDPWGPSIMLNFGFMDEKILKFDKKYVGREDIIHCKFEKKGEGIWVGEYRGEDTGKGDVQCKLYLADDDSFQIGCGHPDRSSY